MKSASPALISFLLNIQDRVAGTPGQFHMHDLFAFILGGTGQIVVNAPMIPSGTTLTVIPPSIGNAASIFLQDLGVRQASNYAPLKWVPSSPAAGQYTVNQSTGAYTFGDSGVAKLVTYAFYTGPVAPQMLFLTSGQLSIQYGSPNYLGGNVGAAPLIDRSRITTKIGLNVDSVDLVIRALPTMQLANGVPVLVAIRQGYFDGAPVLIQRLFMQVYGDTSMGTIVQFKGSVGDVTKIDRGHAEFDVRSRLELLNKPLPPNLYQPTCRHVLGDSQCTINLSSYTFSGVVQSGSNASQIVTNLSEPATAPAPTAAPSLGKTTPHPGPNLPARQEFVVQTYVYAYGESLAGPEANTSGINGIPGDELGGDQLLVVASPSSASGVLGWNCYIGNASGDEMLQNATPIAIGTGFTELFTGPSQGNAPPLVATNGYFSQGTITFTSGVLEGQSSLIQLYWNNGTANVIDVIPPFPSAPSPGDSFVAVAGCDRRMSTCLSKFSNLIHFGGQPFIPDPSIAL